MLEHSTSQAAASTEAGPPKAFISHAGEDRERFVKRFTARLRAKGVDAWASFWEINPGDSLTEKIFEEGLKDCHVFIVVLSRNSVNKPWVREELDAGMVRKIEKQTRMITLRLDGCDIPECLKHIVWQEIPDIDNYDGEFERVLNPERAWQTRTQSRNSAHSLSVLPKTRSLPYTPLLARFT